MQGLIIPLLYRMIHTFKFAMEWEYFSKILYVVIWFAKIIRFQEKKRKKKERNDDDFCRNLMTVTLINKRNGRQLVQKIFHLYQRHK